MKSTLGSIFSFGRDGKFGVMKKPFINEISKFTQLYQFTLRVLYGLCYEGIGLMIGVVLTSWRMLSIRG